jgi:hypothetical protein
MVAASVAETEVLEVVVEVAALAVVAVVLHHSSIQSLTFNRPIVFLLY